MGLFELLNKFLDESDDRNMDGVVKFEFTTHTIHKTKPVFIDKEVKEIDEKIADFICMLNMLGIKTTCSCQGDDISNAYVSFSLKGLSYSYNEKYNELTFRWIIPNIK